MMDWQRHPDEAEEEFIYRVCLEKDNIGSWQDVADILNRELDHEYTESKYRKQFQAFQRMFSANQKHFESDTRLSELEEKTAAYEKAAQKYRDQRSAYAAYTRTDARFENLTDRLVEAARGLAEIRPFRRVEPGVRMENDELIVVLSDWHYGMKCENIWNTYNTEIFGDRVTDLVSDVMQIAANIRPKCIHVVVLGDLAHGAIHTSARVESEETVCEQLIHVSEVLAMVIDEFSTMTDAVKVYTTYGNHMRTVQNKKDSLHEDNIERIIPWWLTTRFAERTDITIVQSPQFYEFIYFESCGKKILATHGDLDGVKTGGKTLNTLWSQRFGGHIDYLLLGDKHHLDGFSDTGIRTIGVGSLCGADGYANSARLYDTPSQSVFHMRPERGLWATYTICL